MGESGEGEGREEEEAELGSLTLREGPAGGSRDPFPTQTAPARSVEGLGVRQRRSSGTTFVGSVAASLHLSEISLPPWQSEDRNTCSHLPCCTCCSHGTHGTHVHGAKNPRSQHPLTLLCVGTPSHAQVLKLSAARSLDLFSCLPSLTTSFYSFHSLFPFFFSF